MPPTPANWPEGPASPTLLPGEIHVWQASISGGTEARERLAPHLSTAELERESRFRFDRDATRYAIARGLLRVLLARYCEAPPAELQILESSHGRPGLAAGTAPPGFDFNLSHSRNLAVFAFSHDARVGVDIEWITPLSDMQNLVALNFSQRERESWHSLDVGDRERAFFDCWTRKEAFVKAIGEGLSHPLDSFDVTLGPSEAPVLQRMAAAPDEQDRWSLRALDPEPGYASALAVKAAALELRCFSLSDERP
jgi:4'-phosphopantetheinyl transferase